MRARVFDPKGEPPERAYGSVLANEARSAEGRIVLRKGTRLGEGHRPTLVALDGAPLHLVELEEGELEQDEVARRLAAAVAGPGTSVVAPVQGQARVKAEVRGLLQVNTEAVDAVNRLHPLLLFTCADGQVMVEGDDVAGAKSASLATPGRLVEEAERICSEASVVEVAAFQPKNVAVLMTDRFEAKARALMVEAITRKIRWFGSEIVAVEESPHEKAEIARRMRACLDAGAELLLLSGANSLDPLDEVFLALESLGGRVERTGIAAHPGSMVWMGGIAAASVFGIATCAGFGKETALDVLLARVHAGQGPADAVDDAGPGGLAGEPHARGLPPRSARPLAHVVP